MSDAEKKDRKPPQPRGLLMEIPLEHGQRALALAAGAGLGTKAEVETELASFVLEKFFEPFLLHLGQLVAARTAKLLGPQSGTSQGSAGLTPDGGIPLVPIP